jgi:putative component of membrane protein insertase Oxa1/YidC/SpoIIIJ protein YidD
MSDAVRSHGARKGLALGLRRLARCHPFGGHGIDPVPLPKS